MELPELRGCEERLGAFRSRWFVLRNAVASSKRRTTAWSGIDVSHPLANTRRIYCRSATESCIAHRSQRCTYRPDACGGPLGRNAAESTGHPRSTRLAASKLSVENVLGIGLAGEGIRLRSYLPRLGRCASGHQHECDYAQPTQHVPLL